MLVVHNCAQSVSLPLLYYHKVDWVGVLNPWLNSDNMAVRLNSQLVLAAVSRGLHSDLLLDFDLRKTDHMTGILEMIGAAVESPDFTVSKHNYRFSATELVMALSGLVSCSSAYRKVVVEEINPPVLLALLACGDATLKRAVCHLLWILASHAPGKLFLKDAHSSVVEALEQLRCSEEEELQKISKCVMLYLEPQSSCTG